MTSDFTRVAALGAARTRFDALVEQFTADMGEDQRTGARDAIDSIRLAPDLIEAVSSADLVIEAVPESGRRRRDPWCSPPTHRLCCPASWPMQPVGPTVSSHCTSPTASGGTIPPR